MAALVNALLNEELQLHVENLSKRKRASKDRRTSRKHGIYKICFRSVWQFSGSHGLSCTLRHGLWRNRRKIESGKNQCKVLGMDKYIGGDYQNLCSELGEVIDNAVIRRLGEKRAMRAMEKTNQTF